MTRIDGVEQETRKPIGAEMIIPAAATLFTIYYFSTILDSPWTAQVGAFFVGIILVALSVIFLVRSGLRVSRREASLGLGSFVTREDVVNGRLAVFVLTLLYTWAIEYGGFSLTTFGFLFLSMAALTRGRQLVLVTGLATGITMTGYLLFIVIFNTRFPRGPVENWLKPFTDALRDMAATWVPGA